MLGAQYIWKLTKIVSLANFVQSTILFYYKKSDCARTKTGGIFNPECSSGGKENKNISAFWLALIQFVFYQMQVYMKAISSNMNINENFTIQYGKCLKI